jgi:hypothetical protein
MSKELKIYGCNLDNNTRAVVAAASLTEAASLFGVSLNFLNGHGGETWNSYEVSVALDHPRQVYAGAPMKGLSMTLADYRAKLVADAKAHYEAVLKNAGKR